MITTIAAIAAAGMLAGTPDTAPGRLVATFSIVARDPSNGDFGVAVQSKFRNVRVAVPCAKADAGASRRSPSPTPTSGPGASSS